MEGDVGASIRETMQAIPYGRGKVVMESIANGREYFYFAYTDGKTDSSIWTSHFHPWFKTADYRIERTDKNFNSLMAAALDESEQKLILHLCLRYVPHLTRG